MSDHNATALEFLEALATHAGGCAPTERLIMQILPGDPGDARDNAWRPRAWRPGELLPASAERTNGYVAISTFGRAPDGSWRRQKGLFQRLLAVMIDDVGTKVEERNASRMEPTWRVLTSPGNEQWIYVMRGGTAKRELADAVINGLVDQALLPKDERDPGMKGVTRVMRVPGFINGKAAYGGAFRVEWTKRSGPLYTLEELREGFGLQIRERRQQVDVGVRRNDDTISERVRAFNVYLRLAQRYRLTAGDAKNMAEWQVVRCPWENEHSSSRAGADIRHPALENEFYGAFRCHHGHCDGRGWREFTDYLDGLVAADLAAGNANWPKFAGAIDDATTR